MKKRNINCLIKKLENGLENYFGMQQMSFSLEEISSILNSFIGIFA